MAKVISFLMTVYLAVLSAQVSADRFFSPRGGVEINVISDSRGELRKFPAQRYGRPGRQFFIEAAKGEKYEIEVRNQTPRRIGVVIAVDGRNVISGKKSYLKPKERMYVLEPWQSNTFSGWRTGKNKVNRFYFTKSDSSYAGAWGDYSAMGVIAAAVFDERPHYRNRYEINTDSMARSAKKKQLGTGFGESEYSPSRVVDFIPHSQPRKKVFLKYETRKQLCKRGVLDCYSTRHYPNRFWPDNEFVRPPPVRYHDEGF